ncbi:MAG: phospholipid carrier-dependent glycosyltransferase, partial [Phycisphaerae bacterium]|nr:phospholipid carrier-dependent glycosyltransferase [Phycisphaerae bacterium]
MTATARRSTTLHYLSLALITALGAVLRFAFLDRPPIWGDEAATFARVCATFDDLLGRLADAGFAPVHYELLWWIGQHHPLTPTTLRMLPAITGTLMVPAMYWITRELLGRPSLSLLVALLTATNAYLLNFSRDAKMYSPFWFFAAVNIASLLWWLRVRRGVAYSTWIASGTAMLAFHSLGGIPLVIGLLIMLASRRANWTAIPSVLASWVLGVGIWLLTIAPFAALSLIPDLDHRCAIAILIVGIINLLRVIILRLLRQSIAVERLLIRPFVGWLNFRT